MCRLKEGIVLQKLATFVKFVLSRKLFFFSFDRRISGPVRFFCAENFTFDLIWCRSQQQRKFNKPNGTALTYIRVFPSALSQPQVLESEIVRCSCGPFEQCNSEVNVQLARSISLSYGFVSPGPVLRAVSPPFREGKLVPEKLPGCKRAP